VTLARRGEERREHGTLHHLHGSEMNTVTGEDMALQDYLGGSDLARISWQGAHSEVSLVRSFLLCFFSAVSPLFCFLNLNILKSKYCSLAGHRSALLLIYSILVLSSQAWNAWIPNLNRIHVLLTSMDFFVSVHI
jgi:hypothetical protein